MKAAFYLRVSDDKQDVQRQRETVPPLCQKHGYEIVDEYPDEGISGSKYQQRPQFMRLLQDAEAGKFQVIVADRLSRFSRQDDDELEQIVWPRLRRANVIVHTVFDGIINPRSKDIGDKITKLVKTHQNSEFLRGLSHDVTTGSMSKAKDGRNMGGVPYGFRSKKDRPDDDNSPRHLVIFEEEAEIVRWIFYQYAHADVAVRTICSQLNRRGVSPPSLTKKTRARKHAPCWRPGTVRRILTNERYTGTQTFGKTARGDFHRIIDGQLVKQEEKGQKPRKNDKYTRVPNAHPAIVGQELFDVVQKKLAENNGKHRKTTSVGGHILSSMIVCGGCGMTMHAKQHHGRAYFQCQNLGGKCSYVTIAEESILGRIDLMLQQRMFKEEVYERHIAELTRKIEEVKVQVDPKEIAKLTAEIEAANEQLAFLPTDLQRGAVAGIRKHQARLEELQAQLKADIVVGDLFKKTINGIQQRMDKFRTREPELRDIRNAAGKTRTRAALSWLKRVTVIWKRRPKRGYELLGMECETQWQDIQKWPPEVADLYLRVLTKPRTLPHDNRSVSSDNRPWGPGLREYTQPRPPNGCPSRTCTGVAWVTVLRNPGFRSQQLEPRFSSLISGAGIPAG